MLSLHVDPRPVALARIGLGLAGLINTVELYVVLGGIAGGRLARPFFHWVPPVTPDAALLLMAIGVTATVAIITGVGTSAGAAVYSVTTATALLWDQQTYSSHQVLLLLLTTYLVFARSDRAYSLARRTGPRPGVPWWPQLLMMTQLSALYFFAGVSKINHEFLSGGPLSGWVRFSLPEWVVAPMAMATIVTEVLVLAIGLWVPRVRVLAVAAGVCLHLSIVIMLAGNTVALIAFALACVPVYLLFLTRPRLTNADHGDPRPLRVDAAP